MLNGIKSNNIKIYNTGYCTNFDFIIRKGGKLKQIKFLARCILIKNSSIGNVLVDTGYSNHFYEETKKFPYNIYGKITPVYVNKEEEVINQLDCKIDYIVITHFHADHIGGLKNFKDIPIICSKEEYNFLKNKRGVKALSHGFIPGLLPEDFQERAIFIEDFKTVNSGREIIENAYVFKNNDIMFIPLVGHTKGHFGVLYKNIFYVADCVWCKENYEKLEYPKKITTLIHYDYKEYKDTIQKVNKFSEKNNVEIIYCHETMD